MKIFFIFILAVVGLRYFMLNECNACSGSAAVELPAWFQPESMSDAQKIDLRIQLEGALAEMDAFIANPPNRT